jgi:hypothetical protein
MLGDIARIKNCLWNQRHDDAPMSGDYYEIDYQKMTIKASDRESLRLAYGVLRRQRYLARHPIWGEPKKGKIYRNVDFKVICPCRVPRKSTLLASIER